MTYKQKKAVFLDRDGVINKEVGFLHKIDDFVFIDSVHTSPNGNKFSAKKIYETIDIN